MTSAAALASWNIVRHSLFEFGITAPERLIDHVCDQYHRSHSTCSDAREDMRHVLMMPLYDPDWMQGEGKVANIVCDCAGTPSLIFADTPGREPIHINHTHTRERLDTHLAYILAVLISSEREHEPLYSNERKIALIALQNLADAEL